MAVQGPPLQSFPVPPYIYESRGGRPLRKVGITILNYLDDWLIMDRSREQLCDHRDMVLRYFSQLGLQVNWVKSKLSPVQRISFLGVKLDSLSMPVRLMNERT